MRSCVWTILAAFRSTPACRDSGRMATAFSRMTTARRRRHRISTRRRNSTTTRRSTEVRSRSCFSRFWMLIFPFCFHSVPTLSTSFSKTTDGYLDVTFEGGAYPAAFTPETCGQLCLDDPCCQSFVAGNSFTGPTQYDCFLAYHNSYTATLIVDPSKGYDYYAKSCG